MSKWDRNKSFKLVVALLIAAIIVSFGLKLFNRYGLANSGGEGFGYINSYYAYP